MVRTFPRFEKLPYRPDSTSLVAGLRGLGWLAFLDSGGRGSGIDVIAADPAVRLVTRGPVTRIIGRDGEQVSSDDPFALVREALGDRGGSLTHLPFEGGAIGYFGYDLGRRIERLPASASDVDGLPEMRIGIHDWAVVVDHEACETWLVGRGRERRTRERWDDLVARLSADRDDTSLAFEATGGVVASLDEALYGERFDRIQDYIRDGDCYQVNFALRFEVPVRGDPWHGYLALRARNPSPFGAYLGYGDFAILSLSPERFLRLRGRHVETQPIKGTRPRGATAEQDARLKAELVASTKDRAENLMIVDLLRNDLGRVCRPGSIHVSRLFDVESFATVHHLVSAVTGELRDNEDAPGLLRACFPGGSITGAPKIRAMEIIEELEPYRRGVYCGAIGYIGFNGDMDTSIAIRTLVTKEGRAWFWAGGGIVADSRRDAEFQECLDKAGFFLEHFSG